MAYYDIAGAVKQGNPIGSFIEGMAMKQAYNLKQEELKSAQLRAKYEPAMLELQKKSQELAIENAQIETKINQMKLANLPQELIDAAKARQLQIQSAQQQVNSQARQGAFEFSMDTEGLQKAATRFPDLGAKVIGDQLNNAQKQIQAEAQKVDTAMKIVDGVQNSEDKPAAYAMAKQNYDRMFGRGAWKSAGYPDEWGPEAEKAIAANAVSLRKNQYDISKGDGAFKESQRLLELANAEPDPSKRADLFRRAMDMEGLFRQQLTADAKTGTESERNSRSYFSEEIASGSISSADAAMLYKEHSRFNSDFRALFKTMTEFGDAPKVGEVLSQMEKMNGGNRMAFLSWLKKTGKPMTPAQQAEYSRMIDTKEPDTPGPWDSAYIGATPPKKVEPKPEPEPSGRPIDVQADWLLKQFNVSP